ncbi:MAG TPA: efflux RND transporter permease subunit [Rugosimonospora sp.]|nr:efflux RND transporter permease subunit [Rugosimonospora sp.]
MGSGLKFRLLALPVAAILIVAGAVQLRRAPIDVLPEFAPPTVQIQTEALGLSAVEVEQFITVPLEQDLLNGVPWLYTIRSESIAGLSTVDLVFQPGTDVLRARQVVQERMTQAVALPHVSKAPVMIEPVSSTSRVMVIGLSAPGMSLIDMSVLARWRIKPRLMGVPGVANVSVWGQRERQLQVQVDPKQLAASGVTLNQVIQTTGNALWVSPLTFVEASTPGTGGFLETSSQRLSIQHVLPITTATDLAKVPLEDAGTAKRLGDVSQVVEDHQPLIGDAVVGGGPGLMLVVEKAPGANTLEVTRGVESALRALGPGLAGVRVDTRVYRPASYIESAAGHAGAALLAGLLLLILLLGLVFLDWRSAVVTALAVLLSTVAAGLVLYLSGAGLNMLVLAGLVVALAVLVDDAVGNVAAIRAELAAESTRDVAAAVARARGPVVYATLIVLVAAVPLLFLGGLAGSFTRPLGWAYLAAVVLSTVVALVVTPALALALSAGSGREVGWIRGLRRGYLALLARTLHWGRSGVVLAALALAGGALLLPQLRGTLLPPLQDRNLLISWAGTPSMSQGETVRITRQASAELRAVPGVTDVGVTVGRAITSDEQVGVNAGQFWVTIRPGADYTATVARIQRVVDGYPGFSHHLLSYPERQVSELQTGTGGDLTVRVFGLDLDVLRAKAEEVRRLVAGVPGVVAPHVDAPAQQPTIEIEVDLAAAQRYGIKPGDVRRATATLLSGLVAGSLFQDQKVFDVVVLGTPSTRDSLSSVRDLLVDTPGGGHVRVGDVAKVQIRPDPVVIRHDSVSRRVDVVADVRGRDPRAVAADIRARLAGVSFPTEYHAEVLQQYAQQGADRAGSWGLVAAAVIVIILLLQAGLGSFRLAGLVLLASLAAPAGGVLAASLTDRGGASLGSLVGLLAVWALAVRQLLALAWACRDGTGEGGSGAAKERFAPVLKTSLAAAAAVLPLVLAGRVAGLEMLRPLAIVVLGGLVTSTLLVLFVAPALFVTYSGRGDAGGARLRQDPAPAAHPQAAAEAGHAKGVQP